MPKTNPRARAVVVAASLLAAVTLACGSTITDLSLTPPALLPTRSGPQPSQPASAPSPPSDDNAEAPDLIFHNGQVITMETDTPIAQAVAIRGDRILAVGSDQEILPLASHDTQRIDLAGHSLMPGFVDPHTHILNDADIHLNLTLDEAQQLAIENGITTIADMFVTPDFLDQMRDLEREGRLRIRTSLYLNYTDNCGNRMGDWYQQHPPTREFGEMLRIGGIKIFADGGSCGEAAVSQVIEPGTGLGDLWLSQAEMTAAVGEAQTAGYQVAIHAIGDRAIEVAQNAIEAALNGGPNTLRHRIEHNWLLRDDLLPRYGEIGILPVNFGHLFTCSLSGLNRTSFWQDHIWRWREMIDANPGLIIAWKSDYPWFGPPSPILHLYTLVTAQEVAQDGSVCYPPAWLASRTITVEEALPMMTIHAAYAIFREDEVGSLATGKLADLIILSDNPLTVESDDIKDIQVWVTMIGGQTEYCAPGHAALCP